MIQSNKVPMMRMFFLLACLFLGGCVTTETRRPVLTQSEMRVGLPSRAWEVLDQNGDNVGIVVLFQAAGLLEPAYMVQNVWHQDLGRVDQLGRAFRYVPHAEEALWIGSGTLTEGVEGILQSGPCQLIATSLDPNKAAGLATLPKRVSELSMGFQKPTTLLPSQDLDAIQNPTIQTSTPGTQAGHLVFPQF